MTRCPICGLSKSCPYEIREKRYFVGQRAVCSDCFNLWASDNIDDLDKKAMKKILEVSP